MYAGLGVAVAVFVTVVILIVCLLRRHKSHLLTGLNDKPSLNLAHVSELAMAPDLTKSAIVSMPEGRSPNDSPNSSVSERARDSIISTQRLLPYSCSTDHALSSSSSSSATARRPPAPLPPNADVGTSGHPAFQLPSNVDMDALVWSTVTSSGGRITLPDSGVSMTIPEGAVRQGQTVDIYLAVSRDDKDRPKLSDVQTLLSAVIVCGPASVRLDKPVVLTFPHCASVKHGQWALSLFTTHSADDTEQQPAWRPICNLGRETINTPVYVQMDSTECHVMTDTLARYTLTGEPRTPTSRAVKILRLAVFAPQVPLSVDYNLRVYFVEDTHDALEGVMQVERRLGGQLLDQPKQMLFQFNNGGNLCVRIEEFGDGWRCKQAASYQEIPFRHIWNGTQNGLHCSFALEHVDRTVDQLTCNIVVCQAELPVNSQQLRIAHNINQSLHASVSQYALHTDCAAGRHNCTVDESGFVSLDQPHKVFRLPAHVKRKLSETLDPPNSRGNDWRMLAQRLSVDRYINYFATKMSPTEHILDLWEARHREDSAITDLMNSLRVMGRMDAAGMIEKELGIASWL
jgi:leucine-rich repeat transmembrane protein FLRT